ANAEKTPDEQPIEVVQERFMETSVATLRRFLREAEQRGPVAVVFPPYPENRASAIEGPDGPSIDDQLPHDREFYLSIMGRWYARLYDMLVRAITPAVTRAVDDGLLINVDVDQFARNYAQESTTVLANIFEINEWELWRDVDNDDEWNPTVPQIMIKEGDIYIDVIDTRFDPFVGWLLGSEESIMAPFTECGLPREEL
ncbi:hypothetical protein, partial [Corynebacterium heidelbergense]